MSIQQALAAIERANDRVAYYDSLLASPLMAQRPDGSYIAYENQRIPREHAAQWKAAHAHITQYRDNLEASVAAFLEDYA